MVIQFLEEFVGVPLDSLSGDAQLIAYGLGVALALGVSYIVVLGLVVILRGWK